MDLNINIPLALKIIFMPFLYKQSKYTNSSLSGVLSTAYPNN